MNAQWLGGAARTIERDASLRALLLSLFFAGATTAGCSPTPPSPIRAEQPERTSTARHQHRSHPDHGSEVAEVARAEAPQRASLHEVPEEAAPLDKVSCGNSKLRIHFYDVAQGLSVLVDLPDGRHILVDTGDESHRPGCGETCERADSHLLASLARDLNGAPLSMIWITHQHSDHLGGAHEVMAAIKTRLYVDNGRDAERREVVRAHEAARASGAAVAVVDPEHATVPIVPVPHLRLTSILPKTWPESCEHDANDCSIGLRVDYCDSSVLFTGDAEADEERELDSRGSVTLLQVGHHGSNTSTSQSFLRRVSPKYAVISAGKPNEGTNRTYCHPRVETVVALTAELGGAGDRVIRAFDGTVSCKHAGPEHWQDIRASDRLWATERDGDVVLETTGDGTFVRMNAM